jgi:hypothetical protein
MFYLFFAKIGGFYQTNGFAPQLLLMTPKKGLEAAKVRKKMNPSTIFRLFTLLNFFNEKPQPSPLISQ